MMKSQTKELKGEALEAVGEETAAGEEEAMDVAEVDQTTEAEVTTLIIKKIKQQRSTPFDENAHLLFNPFNP